jgi:hypothetical protein
MQLTESESDDESESGEVDRESQSDDECESSEVDRESNNIRRFFLNCFQRVLTK